jgi:hypothetical protein
MSENFKGYHHANKLSSTELAHHHNAVEIFHMADLRTEQELDIMKGKKKSTQNQ